MSPSEGLVTSLNAIREMSIADGKAYHQYVPIIDETTDIGALSQPILNNIEVRNDFMSMLINRIVYTQFEIKYFNNPLQVLEGDRIPLGYSGQEIFINRAKGRKFNIEDFAGLLAKYESDVKVQYTHINMDLQYPVTVSYTQLKKAFVSWDALDNFIDGLSMSLYNGAYIDEFGFTKNLVSGAYMKNMAQIKTVSAITTEALAKEFTTQLRELYLNMQLPSHNYNAWDKVGGEGRPIVTWSRPEDIVVIIRNDIRSFLDVNVLAQSFHMSEADLLGRMISVDNFDVYDDNGVKIFDGSNVLGFIGDKSWFRIKRQDMFVEEFRNPNNRTYQMYLNLIKMYNWSLFANGVIIATQAPQVNITDLDYKGGTLTVPVGGSVTGKVDVTPVTGNYPALGYTSSDSTVATVSADPANPARFIISGVANGTATITVKAGSSLTLVDTISVTVGTGSSAEAGGGE